MEALGSLASLAFMCIGIYIYTLHRKLKKGNFEANEAFRIQQTKKKAWIALAITFLIAGVTGSLAEDKTEQLPPENQNAIIAADNQDTSDKLNGDVKAKTEDSDNQSPTDDQEGQLDITSKDKTDDAAAASNTASDTDVQANTNTTAEPEVTPTPAPTPEPEPEPTPAPAPATPVQTTPPQEVNEVKQSSGYVGNKDSKIYHETWCDSVKKMKSKNAVNFSSKEAAEKAGYRGCKNCTP